MGSSNQSPETKIHQLVLYLENRSQEAEMSNQRSETRKGDSQERALGHTYPLCRFRAQASQPFSSLRRAGFQSPIKSNRVTRFILPLGRPWNLCPFGACPYCSERMKTSKPWGACLTSPSPCFLTQWPTYQVSDAPGRYLPHSLVALSG